MSRQMLKSVYKVYYGSCRENRGEIMMKNIITIPIGVSAKGEVEVVLRDAKTKKVKRIIKKHNLTLNEWHDNVLRLGEPLCLMSPRNCYLGDDNTPPQRTDTGLLGNSYGYSQGSYSASGANNPYWASYEFTFNAGTATGNIGEAYFRDFSRITFDPVIEKTDTDELIITYTRYLYRGASSWSGTITGGQRDGVTDIDWVATINDEQLKNIGYYGFSRFVSSGSAYLRLGDSNAPSDLINDSSRALKGNKLYEKKVNFISKDTYSLSRDYRDITLGLEKIEGNGQIGEAVFGVDYNYPSRSFCRVTFNPKLDNVDTYRLYLTLRVGISNW